MIDYLATLITIDKSSFNFDINISKAIAEYTGYDGLLCFCV